jgi:hypothetical protein
MPSPDTSVSSTREFKVFKSVHHHTFIHLAICLRTDSKPLPKRALHIGRSRASSFKWEYPLLSSRSSNSFLRLLPCLPVTSIPPCIFPSVTRFRRQFLRRMRPIQFAFRLRISCRIFLCFYMKYVNGRRTEFMFQQYYHTIQINQPIRCNNFSSILLDVCLQFNMFRASSHPSSGSQQLQ